MSIFLLSTLSFPTGYDDITSHKVVNVYEENIPEDVELCLGDGDGGGEDGPLHHLVTGRGSQTALQ